MKSSFFFIRLLSITVFSALTFPQVVAQTAPGQKSALTIVESRNPAAVYDFGSARFGQKVTRTITLRNDGAMPLTLDRIQDNCGCLTSLADSQVPLSFPQTLPPGGMLRLKVQLDTTRLPEGTSPTLTGSQVEKQVWVYAGGETVHPAAVLTLRGRITRGVAFDPPVLNFGRLLEAQGGSRLVRVQFEPGGFVAGKTRLTGGTEDGLRITEEPIHRLHRFSQIPSGKNPPTSTGGLVVKTYRITVPPHTPVGALSGTLRVVGFQAPKGSSSAPAPTILLPYAGEVSGSMQAQPGMVLVGRVEMPAPSVRLTGASSLEDRQHRTRWILLRRFAPTPATKTAGSSPATKPSAASAFWQGVMVKAEAPWLTAEVAALTKPGSLPNTQRTTPGIVPLLPAPPLPTGLAEESARWLRVTLLSSAPRGKPLNAPLLVTFPNGERLRLPVLADIPSPPAPPTTAANATPGLPGSPLVREPGNTQRPIPDTLSLSDVDGKARTLAEFRGRPVALCFFCGCPWCQEVAKLWGPMQRGGALNTAKPGAEKAEPPVTLVVFSGDAQATRAFAAQTGMDLTQTVLLPDPKMEATRAWKACPVRVCWR